MRGRPSRTREGFREGAACRAGKEPDCHTSGKEPGGLEARNSQVVNVRGSGEEGHWGANMCVMGQCPPRHGPSSLRKRKGSPQDEAGWAQSRGVSLGCLTVSGSMEPPAQFRVCPSHLIPVTKQGTDQPASGPAHLGKSFRLAQLCSSGEVTPVAGLLPLGSPLRLLPVK